MHLPETNPVALALMALAAAVIVYHLIRRIVRRIIWLVCASVLGVGGYATPALHRADAAPPMLRQLGDGAHVSTGKTMRPGLPIPTQRTPRAW